MVIVGLTGGIGCGKSAAANIFKALDVPVTDVDVISHELTAANQPIIEEIKQLFGNEYISADNSLNREAMRALIFSDAQARLKLNALLHPAILEKAIEQLQLNAQLHLNGENSTMPYQVLVVPLLFNNPLYLARIDRILVIDCDQKTQIDRVKIRSQLTESQILNIVKIQTARVDQLKMADDVIMNNGNIQKLRKNIISIHQKYIKTCIVSKTIS